MKKVDIISRKKIKPASPTPPSLRKFNLSLFYQHMSPIYGSFVFFYPPPINSGGDNLSNVLEKSQLLQKSLSETLVSFYPMAGQQKDDSSIDCNDEGAYFVEARIKCQLVDFLNPPDLELLKCFIPINDSKITESALGSILLVQLSIFDCGGMAIAICISHKIADATSDYTFTRSWATLSTRRGTEKLVSSKFIGESLLRPKDLPVSPTPTFTDEKCITRRFVFDGTKIDSLKAKIGDAIGMGHRLPTKVEIVSAFILKCAIAASQSKSKSFKPSLLLQLVNLRKKMTPPMPENSIGNPIWAFEVLIKESEMELHEIVAKMRKGLIDFHNKVNKFYGDGGYEVILESLKQREMLMNLCKTTYWCTSLCTLPFYEIDFGWGKPVWAVCRLPVKNLILLMDTKYGGGIEAWVSLDEPEMAIFERNEELRVFASFNSSLLSNFVSSEEASYVVNSRL